MAAVDDEDQWPMDEDLDDEELLAAWDAVDRHSARVLRDSVSDILAEPAPEPDIERTGLVRAEWLAAVAATISPDDLPEDEAALEAESAVAALEHTDWFGLVTWLVVQGIGTELDPHGVIAHLDISDDDASVVVQAVFVLLPKWRGLGVLDGDDRLTPLGRWGLPRALHIAWVGEDPEGYVDPVDPQLSETDAQAVLGVLAERPMTLDELRVGAAKQGVFVDEEVLRRSIIWRDEVFQCEDGTLMHLPTMVDGAVLTHRLTSAELDIEVLRGDLDIDLWTLMALDGLPLATGGVAKSRFRREEKPLPPDTSIGLVGPEGWLQGYLAGDLLGLRYVDGALALEKLDQPPVDGERVRTVTDAAWRAAQMDAEHGDPLVPGASGADVVMAALVERPTLLADPLQPLSEIVASTELEVVNGYVGLPGTRWEAEPAYLTESELPAYRRWRAVTNAFLSSEEIPDDQTLRELGTDVAVVLDYVAPEISDHPELDPLLERWERVASGRASAVPLFLRSRAAEARGDVAGWQALLQKAVEADPNLPGAAEDLGFLRSVAGDARAAVRLYEVAGLDDDWHELRLLRPLLAVPAAEVGRNQPCPCGSGKKYKVCHGRTARHPLGDRSLALWGKLETFAQRALWRGTLLQWARLFSGEEAEHPETVRYAMGDSFVHGTAIVEGGLLENFLRLLGDLVPDDERTLLERWAETPLRVMEVQTVTAMRGLTVRDLVTDEVLEIRDRRMTTQIRSMDLVLGRPLDDGDGNLRFFHDPLSIARMRRGPLLRLLRDGAPVEHVITHLFDRKPPTLQNTDGHELLECSSRHRLDQPDETWAALGAQHDVDGDRVVVHAPARSGGGRTVRGTYTRKGDEVVIETNSIERLRELQRMLLEVEPRAQLVSESTRPMEAPQDLRSPGVPGSAAGDMEVTPEVLEQIIHSQEDDWLSHPVPALGGSTPREAAANPSLRPELVALLDDFEWADREAPPGALTMDISRLRSELGLDPNR